MEVGPFTTLQWFVPTRHALPRAKLEGGTVAFYITTVHENRPIRFEHEVWVVALRR